MNYTFADIVIRIKNATLARRKKVEFFYTKFTQQLGDLLVKEGFLKNLKQEERDGKKVLLAELSQDRRSAVFTDVKIISKPSLRVYISALKLKEMQRKSLGLIIVSTSGGLMNGKEAIKKSLGGELLCEIW